MRFGGALLLLVVTGCSEGTTPDCSQVRCGPDLDATVLDVQAESSTDGAADAGDASTDGGADAPADAVNDSPLD